MFTATFLYGIAAIVAVAAAALTVLVVWPIAHAQGREVGHSEGWDDRIRWVEAQERAKARQVHPTGVASRRLDHRGRPFDWAAETHARSQGPIA